MKTFSHCRAQRTQRGFKDFSVFSVTTVAIHPCENCCKEDSVARVALWMIPAAQLWYSILAPHSLQNLGFPSSSVPQALHSSFAFMGWPHSGQNLLFESVPQFEHETPTIDRAFAASATGLTEGRDGA